ncbi:hypothetical protein ACSFA0_14595 [Variovorax sp. LT1P1]|uniref:hypothetical protein n=1 Tax=Variovorax sp. LT1P1 TaxID=3443730 RepID=UPI003F48844C
MAIFGDIGTPAWSRLAKYIESRFGEVAPDEQVLTLPVADNAAWDDRIGPIAAFEMYKWGDWMPSNAWQYSPNSSKTISDGYRYFLKAATIARVAKGTASSELKQAVLVASEDLEFRRTSYAAAVQRADDAYAKYLSGTPKAEQLSKAAYQEKFFYKTELENYLKQLGEAMETFKTIANSLKDPDLDLLTKANIAYENPNDRIKLPPIKDVVGAPEKWREYLTSYIDGNIRDFLTETNFQHDVINEEAHTSEIFETRWKVKIDVKFLGFIRAGGASAEKVTREMQVRDNVTMIDISFENLRVFNIERGAWFSQNMIDAFAGILEGEAARTVWGVNGQLELIPKSLLVGRGVSFAIYADSNSLDYMYEHFHADADAGFSVGYWTIGGRGEYSSTKEATKVEKLENRIVFTDLSGRAKILAVLAKHYASVLPALKTPPSMLAAKSLDTSNAKQEILKIWADAEKPEKRLAFLGSNALKIVLSK